MPLANGHTCVVCGITRRIDIRFCNQCQSPLCYKCAGNAFIHGKTDEEISYGPYCPICKPKMEKFHLKVEGITEEMLDDAYEAIEQATNMLRKEMGL